MVSAAVQALVAAEQAKADLGGRIEQTVDLLQRRGYALPPDRLSRILYGGTVSAQEVAAASTELGLLSADGLVHRPGLDVHAVRQRQERHLVDSGPFETILEGYIQKLTRTCPWIDSVLLAGSMSSGGFVAEDDIDLNMVWDPLESTCRHASLSIL